MGEMIDGMMSHNHFSLSMSLSGCSYVACAYHRHNLFSVMLVSLSLVSVLLYPFGFPSESFWCCTAKPNRFMHTHRCARACARARVCVCVCVCVCLTPVTYSGSANYTQSLVLWELIIQKRLLIGKILQFQLDMVILHFDTSRIEVPKLQLLRQEHKVKCVWFLDGIEEKSMTCVSSSFVGIIVAVVRCPKPL